LIAYKWEIVILHLIIWPPHFDPGTYKALDQFLLLIKGFRHLRCKQKRGN